MIRINLIASSKGKRRARPGMPDIPNVGVLLFVLLLVIESAVLYSLHADASEQAQRNKSRLEKVRRDLTGAKKTHAQLTAVRKEVGRLRKQALLFEEIEAKRTGPVGALSYLSFVLKPRDQATFSPDGLKRLEAANWRIGWDANRAWFTYFREDHGTVTLRGAALHHDDVAEVMRRLESSAYYRDVQLVWQERRHHVQLNQDFIVFTLKSDLLYLVEPYLTADQRAEKEAKEAEKAAEELEKAKEQDGAGDGQSAQADEDAVQVDALNSLAETVKRDKAPHPVVHPAAGSTPTTATGVHINGATTPSTAEQPTAKIGEVQP